MSRRFGSVVPGPELRVAQDRDEFHGVLSPHDCAFGHCGLAVQLYTVWRRPDHAPVDVAVLSISIVTSSVKLSKYEGGEGTTWKENGRPSAMAVCL